MSTKKDKNYVFVTRTTPCTFCWNMLLFQLMASDKQKIKSVEELVDRVNALKAGIKERQEELEQLKSIPLPFDTIGSGEPKGFDYKDAILAIFEEEPTAIFTVGDIVGKIASEHKFSPDRNTVSLRVTYLVDNAKKLERAGSKRGLYRLRQKQETPTPLEVGAVPSSSTI